MWVDEKTVGIEGDYLSEPAIEQSLAMLQECSLYPDQLPRRNGDPENDSEERVNQARKISCLPRFPAMHHVFREPPSNA
jgi:hypothetical protein